MPTKRVGDLPVSEDVDAPCQDPQHFAPERKRKPGFYEHTCPTCGLQTTFQVEETEQVDG